ncbi:helix-turn-helix domain-containing protein, partial [uncultured Microbacterium sp.]|uniref:helix-turn-helix domain-containing protein n=1 Tax=uncultured Microbacterium sp. TaxID=191216 RepID=UPI0026066884
MQIRSGMMKICSTVWVESESSEVGELVDDRVMMGRAIRAARARAGLSIAGVSKSVPVTKSSLQRMEMGLAHATLPDLRSLDAALGTGTELVDLYEAQRARREPPQFSFHREVQEAGHRWPASWAGAVWVSVSPTQLAAAPLKVSLTWGPWLFETTSTAPEVVLESYKVPDDVSVALRLTSSRLGVLTRIVVDVGETSVVELELSRFP